MLAWQTFVKKIDLSSVTTKVNVYMKIYGESKNRKKEKLDKLIANTTVQLFSYCPIR